MSAEGLRAAPPTCAEMGARLSALEQAAGDARSSERLAALRAHAGGCVACQRRHAARLARVESLCALRSRATPDEVLGDLSTRVLGDLRRGAGLASRGAMSLAFLDAPRSLARWRRLALAASVLVVSGVALLASGRLTWRTEQIVPPAFDGVDLRDVLLERIDARRPDEGAWDDVGGAPRRGPAQPVLLPGAGRFFLLAEPPRDGLVRPGPNRPVRAAPANATSD